MSSTLEPLVTGRRSDSVAQRLRSAILNGAYPPGSRLPNERELSVALGVNRSSVREALKRLEFVELIEVQHGRGSFVREVSASSALQLVEDLLSDRRMITRDLLAQILEFRRNITTQVVELAARNRTPPQLARAGDLLVREAECGGNPEAALAIDVEWNALLGEATGNLMYQLLSNLFTRLLRRLGPLYYNEHRDDARSLRTHRELYEAISAGDPVESRRILERMLGYSEGAILAEADRLEGEGVIGPGAREGS